MSGTLNKVLLIGHLGDEVKIHYFDASSCIARFSIATNESYRNKKDNQWVTVTEWHAIVVRNKLAEICEKHLSKGDKIYVEGKLKSREWQSEEGILKKAYEIHASEITFLQSKKSQVADESLPKEDTLPESENHGLPF